MTDCWYLKGATQGSTKPTIQKATASDPGCSDVSQEYKPFYPVEVFASPIPVLRHQL